MLQDRARAVYEERLAKSVAREQARKDLPLSTYTEAYWKINLHNLLHFLLLRMNLNAQLEIRAYANMVATEIVAKWVPITWEAFLDYRLNGLQLSSVATKVIAALSAPNGLELACQIASQHGLLTTGTDGHLRSNRERRELEETLSKLGINPPWR
jgi:thymidylate synthase (FAD)